MKDLLLALAILFAGFVTLQIRTSRAPYDYRTDLVKDGKSDQSLPAAFEKILNKKSK